jgi:hypothetical protein
MGTAKSRTLFGEVWKSWSGEVPTRFFPNEENCDILGRIKKENAKRGGTYACHWI